MTSDTIFFGNLCYPSSAEYLYVQTVDVIEVAVLLRNALWISDLDRGDADVIEPLHGLPHLSIYIVFYSALLHFAYILLSLLDVSRPYPFNIDWYLEIFFLQ